MASREKDDVQGPVPTLPKTRVVELDIMKIGSLTFDIAEAAFLGNWKLEPNSDSSDHAKLVEAASLIRNTDIPVAFPTETVYGLGADATRSLAVKGIFKAKQRPADNPLIVHISSLSQLRKLLNPEYEERSLEDPIPSIYRSLIEDFWPGPLTILLPLPTPSPFAPEVTAGLLTVGVRMPSSKLALALIQTAGVPIAAPSANTSTKPSPTTAAHVLQDLEGRIDLILDGGPCDVGLESTVVDGLSQPPTILRPGGTSIEMLRQCPGWKDVRIGYKDGVQKEAPRAPGMKYKHYSPKARVVLYRNTLKPASVGHHVDEGQSIGVVQTSDKSINIADVLSLSNSKDTKGAQDHANSLAKFHHVLEPNDLTCWTIRLGPGVAAIAKGLFSALRELDSKGVSIIFVESVDEGLGETAAAIMNRLRKAAESEIEF